MKVGMFMSRLSLLACLAVGSATMSQAQGTLHWNRDEVLTLASEQSAVTNVVALPTKFAVLDKLVFNNAGSFTSVVAVAAYESSWDVVSEELGTFTVPPNTVKTFRVRPYTVSTSTAYVSTNNVLLTYTTAVTNYFGTYTASKLRTIYTTPQTNLTTRAVTIRPYVFAD